MRVYIVGYGGYIGKSLTEYFTERDYEVKCIGRGTPFPPGFNYRDVIINCACAGWKDGDTDPMEVAKSNIVLPMELHRRRNGAVLIHLSSGIEEVQPRHPYAMTKGVASWLMSGVAHVLYLYTIWGGRHVQMTRYMSSLMKACVDGTPYTISTPNHTRDFVHIDTLCPLIEELMYDRDYRILQVGSGRPIALIEAFDTLRRVAGKDFSNVSVDWSDSSEMLYRALHPCLADTFEADVRKEWAVLNA